MKRFQTLIPILIVLGFLSGCAIKGKDSHKDVKPKTATAPTRQKLAPLDESSESLIARVRGCAKEKDGITLSRSCQAKLKNIRLRGQFYFTDKIEPMGDGFLMTLTLEEHLRLWCILSAKERENLNKVKELSMVTIEGHPTDITTYLAGTSYSESISFQGCSVIEVWNTKAAD